MPMTSADVALELRKMTEKCAEYELQVSKLLAGVEDVFKAVINCNGQGADIAAALALHNSGADLTKIHPDLLAALEAKIRTAVDQELTANYQPLGGAAGGAGMADVADINNLPA